MKIYNDRHDILDRTVLRPMPQRPIAAERVLRVGREVLAISKGEVYSNYASNRGAFMGYPRYLVEALTKLGVFTKKQLAEWSTAEAKREQTQGARFSANALGQNMKVLGIKPTKAQQAKLDAILGNMTKERAS